MRTLYLLFTNENSSQLVDQWEFFIPCSLMRTTFLLLSNKNYLFLIDKLQTYTLCYLFIYCWPMKTLSHVDQWGLFISCLPMRTLYLLFTNDDSLSLCYLFISCWPMKTHYLMLTNEDYFSLVYQWELFIYCWIKCIYTVGENIIATNKIRNNYAAIKSLIFSNIALAILDFYLLLLVKLSLLILFASFLVSAFASLLMVLSLKLSIFLALKGNSEKITVTFC